MAAREAAGVEYSCDLDLEAGGATVWGRSFDRRLVLGLAVVALLAVTAGGCSGSGESRATTSSGGSAPTIQLTSPAFTDGAPIPAPYTCDGQDISPPLQWRNLPPGVRSLALIVEDPDAPGGTFTHWVLYGIPPSVSELKEGVSRTENTEFGAKQGLNDFHQVGYRGPCPPPNSTHRYVFRLYALDADLNLEPGKTKQDFTKAMEGRIIAEGQSTGTYRRK